MDLIRSYIKNIVTYMIFDAFIVIIFPDEKYKKYISLVSGFILVLIMLTPINNFICYFNKNKVSDGLIKYKYKLNSVDNKFLSEAVKKQIKNISNNIGFEIKNIDLDMNNKNYYEIKSLRIKLADDFISDEHKKKFIKILSVLYNLENKNISFY